MSSIKLESNASGTGIFTIASPNSNTNRTLTLPDNTGTVLTSATTTGFPAGSVIQVVSSVKTDSYFTTSGGLGSWLDIPGQGGSGTWSVSITPSSSSNKILILSMLTFRNDYYGAALRLRRDSTSIAVGDSVSNTFQGTMGQFWLSGTNEITRGANISFLDSPATTSAIVYKVQFQGNSNGSYIGRTVSQTASSDNGVYPSSIIAMEVAG